VRYSRYYYSRRDERADAERLAAEVVEVGTHRGTPSTHRGTLSTHRGYSRRDERADTERLAAQVVEVLVVRERRHLRRYNAGKFVMMAQSYRTVQSRIIRYHRTVIIARCKAV
jgi:hypothetical protein